MERKINTINVKLYTGPMYAGKSNAVIETVEDLTNNGKKVLCFKHTFDDNRFGINKVVSRTGKETKAFSVNNYKDIKEIVKKHKNIDTIVIDELQFFGINNNEEIEGFIKMLRSFTKKGIEIVLAGLDKTFENEYFPITKRLIGNGLIKRENITYLKAHCSVKDCKNDGTHSARIIKEKELVVVGNGTKYKAVCENHHNYCNGDIDYNKIEWKTKIKKDKTFHRDNLKKNRTRNVLMKI